MKIKRFEAGSMSDALRMIKKEFGEEAVILSAKTLKKTGRIFGPKSDQVVVTAAVDTPVAKGHEASDRQPSEKRTTGAAGEASSPRFVWNRYEPITRTGREKLRERFVQLSAAQRPAAVATDEHPLQSLERRLVREGISKKLTAELIEKTSGLLGDEPPPEESDIHAALVQIISAKGLAAPAGPKSRVMVLIGPCGAGKTTMAAKLAAEAAIHGRRAALISIDQQRVAGVEELERYARIMDIPLSRAGTPQELAAALARHKDADLKLIDTPGIGLNDDAARDHLAAMIKRAEPAEVHLLINAAFCGQAMHKTIEQFKTLGPRQVIFTQMDWAVSYGELLNTAEGSGLSVSYLSNTPRVSDGVVAATAERLVNLLWPESYTLEEAAPVNVVKARNVPSTDELVANCNSDIFHRHSCRAVKRINAEHMITFSSADDALGQAYKPCRMCCADLYVPKPIHRPVLATAGRR